MKRTVNRINRTDPAERMFSLRLFYRDWRPTRLGKLNNSAMAWLSAHGLTPPILLTLQVRGRRSGQLHSTVLAPITCGGDQYLVSMLGETSEWVLNARAAGGEAFVMRRQPRPVQLTEIPAEQRAPILKGFAEIATSGRHHLPVPPTAPLSAFEAIAADYPVFRIDAR